jgi:hypothetical protein
MLNLIHQHHLQEYLLILFRNITSLAIGFNGPDTCINKDSLIISTFAITFNFGYSASASIPQVNAYKLVKALTFIIGKTFKSTPRFAYKKCLFS